MNNLTEILNSSGERFIEFAVPMLIQSSVLIVILLAVDLLLRKKVRATFRYWLWMLVLVKLALPPSFSLPVSFGRIFGDKIATAGFEPIADSGTIIAKVEVPTEAVITKTLDASGTQGASAGWPRKFVEAPVIPIATNAAGPTEKGMLSWQAIVLVVWAGVAGAMVMLVVQRLFFVIGLIRQAQPARGLLTETLEFCRKRMGVNLPIRLKISANATSPAVCGLIRPVILVPQDIGPSLGVGHLRPVLMHELGHIKRGDLWVNLIQTVLQIIYFYNPLLWLANAVIRRIREQAVDEMVQVAMGNKAQDYPETLLNVAKLAFNRPALALRFIGVVESKSQLQERIKKMLNQPIPKTAKLGLAGLAAIIITAAVLLPMAAAQKENQASPGGITAEKAKELVEDFFNHNYRDITARQTIEWGEPEKDENGNVSIRYKYEATIWGKDKIIENKIFTFDKNSSYISAVSLPGFPQKINEKNSDINPTSIPYTQELVAQIRPDGTIDFVTTIKQINESNSDIATTSFINSDFVEVTSISDGKGRPIRFTTEHKDDIYSYQLFFNEPVKPNELIVYSQKGTMTGLIKSVESLENTYRYVMNHWPGTGKSTRRIETYLLPEGANLISTTPSDMGRRMQNGRIELHVDEIIPAGKSITTAFQYSLITDEYRAQTELTYDDGKNEGKWSFSGGGHGVKFSAPSDGCVLKAVKLYGSRYGEYEAPQEDFDVWVCDKNFNVLANFKFPYSTFAKRGYTKWATLNVDDVEVPKEFAICVAFDPHQTKGIYVYHDAKGSGHSYQGIPPEMEAFGDGDWMIRAVVETPGGKAASGARPSRAERMEAENLASDAWKLWAERKLAEAEDMFRQAVEKDPTNANAWNGLGWAQQNQGKKENARYSFERCLELEPRQAAALNGLGWIAKSEDKTDQAIEYWKKAVRASGGNATASLSGLTQTYMELGKYDEAIKYYEMWLRVEPNNEEVKNALAKAQAMLQK
jgi:beta-lactamase regulating signal transducer with metallopeptidase domain/tetratricopeptide (TPR) repeat protein